MSDETTTGAEGTETLPGTKPGWKMETAEGADTVFAPPPEDGPPTIVVAAPAATDDPTPPPPAPDEDDADGDEDEGGEPPPPIPPRTTTSRPPWGSLALLLLLALLLGGATWWLWRDKTPEPTPTDQDAHLVVGGYELYEGVSRDSRGTRSRTHRARHQVRPGGQGGGRHPAGCPRVLCGDRPPLGGGLHRPTGTLPVIKLQRPPELLGWAFGILFQ